MLRRRRDVVLSYICILMLSGLSAKRETEGESSVWVTNGQKYGRLNQFLFMRRHISPLPEPESLPFTAFTGLTGFSTAPSDSDFIIQQIGAAD